MKKKISFCLFISFLLFLCADFPVWAVEPPYNEAQEFHAEESSITGIGHAYSNSWINPVWGQIHHNGITGSYLAGLTDIAVEGQGTVFQNNSCNNNYVGYVSNEKGTIQLISPKQDWYVIILGYDDMQRFLPTNLPDIFKKDGLKVIFSGKICEIPENVRLIGTPLLLTSIKKEVIE